MKNLSFWAKSHPKQARIYIAISHVLMLIISVISGIYTFIYDFPLSNILLTILIVIFSAAYIFYPIKGHKSGIFKYTYFKQKSLDFTFMITYALIIICAVNQIGFSPVSEPLVESNSQAVFVVKKSKQPKNLFQKFSVWHKAKKNARVIKKKIKTELSNLKKDYHQNPEREDMAIKILLTILLISVIVGLGMLVGALSCELSCSGQEGLAILVLVVGWGALILGGIFAIRYIFRVHAQSDTGVRIASEL